MAPKHFILMLFWGYLTNTSLTEAQAYSTVSPLTTPFKSSISDTSANFGNGTENPLSQPLPLINTPSGQPPPLPISRSSGQSPTPPVPGSSGQLPRLAVPTSSRQPPSSSIPKSSGQTPVPPVPKSSSQPVVSLVFNSTRQSPKSPVPSFSRQSPASPRPSSTRQSPASPRPSSTRQSPASPRPSSTRQSPASPRPSSTRQSPASPGPSSTRQSPASPGPSSTRQSASTVVTPRFNEEKNNDNSKTQPQSFTANSIAAVLIGIILTFMIVIIFMIVLWKCFRKPVPTDQNWAGRSPFADGETPDMCMDYSRENGKSIKRSSIVSLEIWKPNKSMLLADDLDVKLFDSSENLDECPRSDLEKMKDQPNEPSEESADRLTVGTAISSSEETELTPVPPLLDLDGPENQKPDSSNLTENDLSHLPPPLDCLDSRDGQTIPPPSDSSVLPPPPEALLKDQEECSSEVHIEASSTLETQFPITPDSNQQVLDESLPPPPAELL